MKKLFLALMFLPVMGFFTACSDDSDDLPEVDMEVTISGGVQSPDDNKIYIEQGTPLVVESVNAVSRNGKKTMLGMTTYYLNGIPQFTTSTVPFNCTLNTSTLEPGEYSFQIRSAVYQIDKSAAYVLMSYVLVVQEPTTDDGSGDAGTDTETTGRSIVKPNSQQIAQQ